MHGLTVTTTTVHLCCRENNVHSLNAEIVFRILTFHGYGDRVLMEKV